MPLTQITTSSIANGAVTLAQLAPSATPGPKITQIQITNSGGTVLDDTAISLNGGYIKITGTGFAAGAQVIVNNTPASSTTFTSTTVLNAQVGAQVAGTYVVYVVNADGGVAIAVNGLTYSSEPSWVTGSSLSGTVSVPISIQLSASNATVYSLAAGSTLPAGLTLSSSGLLSGTVTGITSETVYSFTVNAIDAELQDSPRTFSITITVGDPQFRNVTTLLNPELSVLPFNDDASTNNFAVSVFGDTRPNNFGPYTPGYYSNFFDGTGDYLQVPANSAFQFTGNYTVEFWLYLNSTAGVQDFIGNFVSNGSASDWTILLSVGRIEFYPSSASSSVNSPAVVSNRWYHVAAVRSSNTCSLYLDGVSVGTPLTFSGTLGDNTKPIFIGSRNSGSNFPNGYISNVRIVNGTAVYTAAFTPSTTPLTAITNTSLLTCQSNRFIDNSTNNFAITRFGDTRIDGFDPFVPSSSTATLGSTYFDGTGDYLSLATNSAFGYGTGAFTIECWFNTQVIPPSGGDYLFDQRTTGTQAAIAAYITPSAALDVYINGAVVITGGTVVVNTWNHFALTKSGTTTRMFLNGVQVGSSYTDNVNYVSPAPVVIGSRFSAEDFYQGYISNFQIVKGTALYTANFTPPAAPLTAIANTSLLTCQTNQPNNNNMFLDSSTNNFLVTRNGNTTQGAFSPYGGGWSNYFDGTGDFLNVGSSTNLALGAANWTVEAWIYPTSVAIGQNIIADWRSSNDGLPVLYMVNNQVLWRESSATKITSSITLSANTWYHVAVVKVSTTTTMYINGVSVGSYTDTTNYANADFKIGKAWDSNFWNGYISNLRIVKGTAVYTSNFTPPTAPLQPITGTALLTCADNRFIDDSPNNFAITRNGDVSVQKFNPFGIQTAMTPQTYSAFFDGSGDRLTSPADFALGTNGNWTIEAFVNPSSISTGTRYILGLGRDTGGTTPYLQISTDSSGRLYVDESSTVSQVWTITTTQVLPAGVFSHIALVQNGSAIRFYFNGILIGSTTFSSAHQTAIRPWIGELLFGGGGSRTDGFIGYISNVRYVNGVSVYSGTSTTTPNFTPPTQPLTAISGTQLLTCQNTTFIDNSTNNFAITVTGNTQPLPTNPFGFTAGTITNYTPQVFGGSMFYGTRTDSLGIPASPGVKTFTGDFSIEAWVYPTDTAISQWGIWDGRQNGQTANAIVISVTPLASPVTGQGRLEYYNGTVYKGTGIVLYNSWSHVAIVRIGSTLTFYVNGVAGGTATISGTQTSSATSNPIFIGSKDQGAGGVFGTVGYISDLRVINGTALYTSSFVPPAAPVTPVTNTTLLVNGTSASIYDSSTLNNLETVGGARNVTNVIKYGNTSMFFGTGGGAYAQTPINQPAFGFGTGDFTIEMWINPAPGISYVFFDTRRQTENRINLALDNNSAGLKVSVGTGAIISVASGVTPGSWNYIAVTRASGSLRMFINGTQVGSTTTMTTDLGATGSLCLATAGDARGNGAYGYTGYISDLRITNGIARYTANFTPPAIAFPTQ